MTRPGAFCSKTENQAIMGKDATGKKDADNQTKEMYKWRDDYGDSFEILNVIWRAIKMFHPYDVDFIFLQNFVQNMFRADEWNM